MPFRNWISRCALLAVALGGTAVLLPTASATPHAGGVYAYKLVSARMLVTEQLTRTDLSGKYSQKATYRLTGVQPPGISTVGVLVMKPGLRAAIAIFAKVSTQRDDVATPRVGKTVTCTESQALPIALPGAIQLQLRVGPGAKQIKTSWVIPSGFGTDNCNAEDQGLSPYISAQTRTATQFMARTVLLTTEGRTTQTMAVDGGQVTRTLRWRGDVRLRPTGAVAG
jgi:hypothetical protein